MPRNLRSTDDAFFRHTFTGFGAHIGETIGIETAQTVVGELVGLIPNVGGAASGVLSAAFLLGGLIEGNILAHLHSLSCINT